MYIDVDQDSLLVDIIPIHHTVLILLPTWAIVLCLSSVTKWKCMTLWRGTGEEGVKHALEWKQKQEGGFFS